MRRDWRASTCRSGPFEYVSRRVLSVRSLDQPLSRPERDRGPRVSTICCCSLESPSKRERGLREGGAYALAHEREEGLHEPGQGKIWTYCTDASLLRPRQHFLPNLAYKKATSWRRDLSGDSMMHGHEDRENRAASREPTQGSCLEFRSCGILGVSRHSPQKKCLEVGCFVHCTGM